MNVDAIYGLGEDVKTALVGVARVSGREVREWHDLKRAIENARKSGVYFVKCGAFVKIGISTDLAGRLCSLQSSVPFDIELLAFLPVPFDELTQREGALHRQFAHLRHRGEWFRLANDLLVYIASVKEAQ